MLRLLDCSAAVLTDFAALEAECLFMEILYACLSVLFLFFNILSAKNPSKNVLLYFHSWQWHAQGPPTYLLCKPLFLFELKLDLNQYVIPLVCNGSETTHCTLSIYRHSMFVNLHDMNGCCLISAPCCSRLDFTFYFGLHIWYYLYSMMKSIKARKGKSLIPFVHKCSKLVVCCSR